jgi:integrase
MSANLLAWLEPFRADKKVWPVNWHRLHYVTVRAVGIQDWPHDAMRHSYASYLMALCQNSGRVADQMGHASPDMICRRYRRLVKPNDATAFWQIFPDWYAAPELPPTDPAALSAPDAVFAGWSRMVGVKAG